jgi:hypothetical protein
VASHTEEERRRLANVHDLERPGTFGRSEIVEILKGRLATSSLQVVCFIEEELGLRQNRQ